MEQSSSCPDMKIVIDIINGKYDDEQKRIILRENPDICQMILSLLTERDDDDE